MAFAGLNRNKRCLAVDVKSKAGKEIVLQLVQSADVLVHNFRPKVMDRLGLGYQTLKELSPRLIYAYSSGWGDDGPYVERGRAGHNVMALAAAGWFEPKEPGGLPVRVGMSADYPAGLMLTIGILTALAARERTGEGQLVTTDLLSVAFHAHAWESGAVLNRERVEDRSGLGVTEQVIDKSFRTRDGLIELSPVFSPNALRDISVAMGLGDLSQDPRFNSEEKQLEKKEELNAVLAECFLEKTTEEWISILEPQRILCGEIKSFEEATEDPQIHANEMVVEMEHPRLGGLQLMGTPLRLYGTPPSYRRPPADLGEHNREVLSELGYSEEEIDKLEEQGVLG
jgi:crotonobetainyl-CoA:carnitine CoA-transferase CaiB-like acyl-CoA transferase